jgi:hypothetical protein
MQHSRPSAVLVAELDAIRQERNLSNRQFADLLGIDNVTWFQIKSANLSDKAARTPFLGTKVLMAFARLDPKRVFPFIQNFLLHEPGIDSVNRKPRKLAA